MSAEMVISLVIITAKYYVVIANFYMLNIITVTQAWSSSLDYLKSPRFILYYLGPIIWLKASFGEI